MGLPAVYLRGARKSFDGREVLKGVSLTIRKGEVLALIGPSGAGKSTLLRGLTLLDTYDAGELAYGSVRVCTTAEGTGAEYDRTAMREARMRFGIVFQSYNLFPHRSVLQNVMDAPIVVQRRDRGEVEDQARRLLERLGLNEHAEKVPCQLSGGQQQRVAIARALCMRPQVIYFDEATSALDPRLTADMHLLIRELAAEGMAVGMAVGIVTHEMGFAREVSDRVAFLFDGQIVEEGDAAQVLGSPTDERTRSFLADAED
ncbi:MAG: amino acid ABC transporter ATP-binding protein [Olsenella uli]|nr:amino acid ABC transporter ATP-binding protein [Olsenella uli]